jgi:Na+-transporting methylmalonyl-CoA/oxaloacetate decarboxylase gamma subunit
MDNDLILGLYISAVGLGLTFIALGSLILVIRFLVALFPQRTSAPANVEERRREEEAAALAVGISLLQEQAQPGQERDPSLGRLLEKK